MGISLAKHFQSEIISADSRQFYKEMHIGTAKPTTKEMCGITHHFVDCISVNDKYTAWDFQKEVHELLNKYYKDNSIVFLVGGAGLFIDAICKGLDEFPELKEGIREELNQRLKKGEFLNMLKQLETLDPVYYKTCDKNNPRRVIRALEICLSSGKPYSDFLIKKQEDLNFKVTKIGLKLDRGKLVEKINNRVDTMIKKGLLNEVRTLEKVKDLPSLNTVGYKELFDFLDGNCNMEKAVEQIKINTRRYSKRQMTWFRKDKSTNWFDPDDIGEMISFVSRVVN